MPGFVMDEIVEADVVNGTNGSSSQIKENSVLDKSPNGSLGAHSPQNDVGLPVDGAVDTSIEKLYDNVCEMQSSDQSPSRHSFASDGDESRIDSELRHLVGGEMREVEIMEEEERMEDQQSNAHIDYPLNKESMSAAGNSGQIDNGQSASSKSNSLGSAKKASKLPLDSETSVKLSPNRRSPPEKPPADKQKDKSLKKQNEGVVSAKKQRNLSLGGSKLQNGTAESVESGLDNPDLGPFLLKQARTLVSSGDNLQRALEFALRAAKSFEICASGKPSLELVMTLHVVAAIHCNLGQYIEAIPVLQHSIEIPVIAEGQDHALAKFAGNMQLGDTYAMLGQLENSILCYTEGLQIQRQILGDKDLRVGETCRYLAEAHVQALNFDEAEKLCQMALDIHRENGFPASVEEAADRRLMGLICETKGDHEGALEHLVLASMSMVANGQEVEVASVDCSIGDAYLSLTRYDEAVFAYQKALTVFKTSKGENHPSVASVFVRLADLYNKTGKLREAKSYCENALRIYGKPIPGIPPEEIASGLTDVSAIYESMDEIEQALKLLEKALKIYNNAPGQQRTVAGIEAQMGVMYYMLGKYSNSYTSLKSAISQLRATGEKKSAFFGIAVNQMGLACVQLQSIQEALELFEEARNILEQQCGPYHPDTIGVYSNLAATYDAVGRLDEAIELLERVVRMREEKLGTANPDVDDEKKRLAELLKDAGRARTKKARSFETFLDANSHTVT